MLNLIKKKEEENKQIQTYSMYYFAHHHQLIQEVTEKRDIHTCTYVY